MLIGGSSARIVNNDRQLMNSTVVADNQKSGNDQTDLYGLQLPSYRALVGCLASESRFIDPF